MIFSRTFTQYTKELSAPQYNPLSKEEERELLLQMSSGSVVAKERIIRAHLRFVVYLLRDIKIPQRFDPMDIVQEGNEGLIYALSKFKPELYSNRIATYAMHYIRWYFFKAMGVYEKDKDIVEHNLPEEFNFDNVEDCPQVQETIHIDIYRYLSTFLNTKELKIISLLYGLEYPYKPLTMREVGSMFYLNSERIRQIRNEVIKKLKENKSSIQPLIERADNAF